jgi:hypothetical protein
MFSLYIFGLFYNKLYFVVAKIKTCSTSQDIILLLLMYILLRKIIVAKSLPVAMLLICYNNLLSCTLDFT